MIIHNADNVEVRLENGHKYAIRPNHLLTKAIMNR